MSSEICSIRAEQLGDEPPADASRRIDIVPNCSLNARTAALFLGATGGLTLLIAVILAFQGLWPVLPFAGIEVALLVWATGQSMRRGKDREAIEITRAAVTIESLRGGAREITVFPRHWAKVKLHAPQHTLHPGRLTIEVSGYAREVGHFLTEDERRRLAARLTQLIGNVNESPALGPDGAP